MHAVIAITPCNLVYYLAKLIVFEGSAGKDCYMVIN